MTNTTNQSGQRPPATNRPTDAEIAALLRTASNALRIKSPNILRDFSDLVTAGALLDIADALDAAPSASCAWCGRPATENGIYCSECRHSREAIEDAFPHLAPDA